MIRIVISKLARKGLSRAPKHISIKFDYWCDLLNAIGLAKARKYKGFHDEPLQGLRFGQRSVRLSRSYRAIYREISGRIDLIEILEVSKHDY